MSDTDIFKDYDMVVAVTQKAINAQLAELVAQGVIPSRLRVVRTIQGRNYVYRTLAPGEAVPQDAQGNPLDACIDGVVVPRIAITGTGTIVTFQLHFASGTAFLGTEVGPLATLMRCDMSNWSFGVAINLDLKALQKDDIGNRIPVPALVQRQLTAFTGAMFQVSHLFLDFESSDLMTTDPAATATPGASAAVLAQFTEFMQFYLSHLKGGPNPYILGYVPTADPRTYVPPNLKVPDVLQPVGVTYTLFHDASNPDASTVNFVLATRGGRGAIAGTPANFQASWIPAGSGCDAMVTYSHSILLEALVLRPFYEQLAQNTYNQVRNAVDVPGSPGNSYDAAKSTHGASWSFAICDSNIDDDRYQNAFEIKLGSLGNGVEIDLRGTIYAQKEKSENLLFTTAEATAQVWQPWTGTISLQTVPVDPKTQVLQVASQVTPGHQATTEWENSAAKGVSILGDIFGTITSIFSVFTGGFFANLLNLSFGTSVGGLANLGAALRNLSASVQTTVLLPTGSSFTMHQPTVDAAGNVSLQLDYHAASTAVLAGFMELMELAGPLHAKEQA